MAARHHDTHQNDENFLAHNNRDSLKVSATARATPTTLAFDNICYSIPPPGGIAGLIARRRARHEEAARLLVDEEVGMPDPLTAGQPGEKRILHNLTGVIRPGQLVAIMGSSGAGKTTFLDLLAGRDKTGIVTGSVTVNGRPRDEKFKRLAGYVTQDDCLLPLLTVTETLMFYANLKLPSSVSYEEKVNKVNALIEDLGLEKVRDSRIGSQFQRGISGGEKKRVSIGCELITDPSILFLDEPTTGLDSYNSMTVAEKLHQLARRGHSIVCTIHQPRSSIFAQFDSLMLLSEGHIVYFGPTKEAVPHMAQLGFHIKPLVNPADFLLDVIIENEDRKKHKSKERRELSESARSYSYTPATLRHRKKQRERDRERERDSSASDDDSQDEDAAPVHAHAQDLINRSKLKGSSGYQKAAASNQWVDLAGAYKESRQYEQQVQYLKEAGASGGGNHDGFSFSTWMRNRTDLYARSWFYQMYILSIRAAKNLFRNPMTTYITWMMSCLMGLLVGSIYWQMGDDQRSIQNRLGALFFIITNQTMSNFGILNAFMMERPNFNREREARCYSTSAYFFSKNLIEMPWQIIFPFTMGSISYWMCGFQADLEHYLTFICSLIVYAATAASLLLFLGALAPNLQVATVIAPLTLVLFLLFGGFYINSADIPVYYIWIKYISFFKYGFEIFVLNEFKGLEFECNGSPAQSCTGEKEIDFLDMQDANIWYNLAILGGMIVAYRLLAYLCLRVMHKERR